jgi:hypothetical protein
MHFLRHYGSAFSARGHFLRSRARLLYVAEGDRLNLLQFFMAKIVYDGMAMKGIPKNENR